MSPDEVRALVAGLMLGLLVASLVWWVAMFLLWRSMRAELDLAVVALCKAIELLKGEP